MACCISADLSERDERIADSLKPATHPNELLFKVIVQKLLVASDDILGPEMHAAEVPGQKISPEYAIMRHILICGCIECLHTG